MSKDLPPPPNPAGFSLDGSEAYTITAEQNAALCRSIGCEPASDGTAHPIYYYIATQIGMGPSVAEFCEACDFDVDDGPMIVGSEVTFRQPLMVDQPYTVTGSINSLDRKMSRKLGVMDLAEYTLDLHADDMGEDAVVLESKTRWVLPRKELS
ncbi:hypothetical protein [Parasphingorhabdus sp.]|uniref:hypothetical protein n=1 Tax=Parasphingorhabdus sp. TaxID=2709688 RepID=UPI002F944ADB